MTTKKILNWFISEKGQHASYILAGTIATLTPAAYFVSHTIFLEQYKKFKTLYSKGFSVPVPEELLKRFDETLELLKVPSIRRTDCRPFMTSGFDICSAGSGYSRFGIIVGLPNNFMYNDVDSLDKPRIKVNLESVNWELPASNQLLESLIFSENAQKYAIARELRYRESVKPLIDVFLTTTALLMTYGLSRLLNTKFNLYVKHRIVRLGMYGLVSLLSFGNYFLCKDAIEHYYEEAIDEELKKTSPIFVEGGKEYYSNIIKRNIALRELMGKEGRNLYSPSGNVNYLFRQKHIPLVDRKGFFETDSSQKNKY